MRHLDLFSGIGGFALAARRVGWETIGFCEPDRYCQAVLAKHWPGVPIHPDIREYRGHQGAADVITGGFPCTDISYAGNGLGLDGPDSGLWAELARVIGEVRPRYAVMENVSALLARGLGQVLGDLAEIGYDAEWHCVPAWFVGAPQARDRIWIVAYPDRTGRSVNKESDGWAPAPFFSAPRDHDARLALAQRSAADALTSGKCRVDDGVPRKVDRVRACGNALYPAVAEMIFRALPLGRQSMNELLYPPTFDEWFKARIVTADVHDFAQQPYTWRRYNPSGIDKLVAAGIPVMLDVRDFGAVGDGSLEDKGE